MPVDAPNPVTVPGQTLTLNKVRLAMFQLTWPDGPNGGQRVVGELVKSQLNADGSYTDSPRKPQNLSNAIRTTVVLDDWTTDLQKLVAANPELANDPAIAAIDFAKLIEQLTSVLTTIAKVKNGF